VETQRKILANTAFMEERGAAGESLKRQGATLAAPKATMGELGKPHREGKLEVFEKPHLPHGNLELGFRQLAGEVKGVEVVLVSGLNGQGKADAGGAGGFVRHRQQLLHRDWPAGLPGVRVVPNCVVPLVLLEHPRVLRSPDVVVGGGGEAEGLGDLLGAVLLLHGPVDCEVLEVGAVPLGLLRGGRILVDVGLVLLDGNIAEEFWNGPDEADLHPVRGDRC